jgi:hypothetical protein
MSTSQVVCNGTATGQNGHGESSRRRRGLNGTRTALTANEGQADAMARVAWWARDITVSNIPCGGGEELNNNREITSLWIWS